MTATVYERRPALATPFASVCLAGSWSLFLGAALSDAAYATSYEIQWSNFAAWLLLGGLLLAGVALAFALRNVLSANRRSRSAISYAVVLGLGWLTALVDTLVHARDAWASMPTGLVQSCIALALVSVATFMAFREKREGQT